MTEDPWTADLWAAITLRCTSVQQFNELRLLATLAYSEIGGTVTREMAERAAEQFTEKVEALGVKAPVVDADELRAAMARHPSSRGRRRKGV
jgi:hypothetical protein